MGSPSAAACRLPPAANRHRIVPVLRLPGGRAPAASHRMSPEHAAWPAAAGDRRHRHCQRSRHGTGQKGKPVWELTGMSRCAPPSCVCRRATWPRLPGGRAPAPAICPADPMARPAGRRGLRLPGGISGLTNGYPGSPLSSPPAETRQPAFHGPDQWLSRISTFEPACRNAPASRASMGLTNGYLGLRSRATCRNAPASPPSMGLTNGYLGLRFRACLPKRACQPGFHGPDQWLSRTPLSGRLPKRACPAVFRA